MDNALVTLLGQLAACETPIIHTGYWECEGGTETDVCRCEHPGRKGYHPAIGIADNDSLSLIGYCFQTPEMAMEFLAKLSERLCDIVGLNLGPDLSLN